jgi:hypothetical protein
VLCSRAELSRLLDMLVLHNSSTVRLDHPDQTASLLHVRPWCPSRFELADWLADCKGSMNQWSPPPALFNVCDSVPPTLPAFALTLAPPLCRASPKGI